MRADNVMTFNINDYCTPANRYGYLDANHEYRILVALNDDAADKLWRCQIYDEEDARINRQMICLNFHEDTFYYMEGYIFLFLNAKLDLSINMYEEEIIDTEHLDGAISVMKNIINNTDNKAVLDFGQKLLEMLKIAKERGTIIGFYF